MQWISTIIRFKDFDDALDFAVQLRRFLILHASQKAKQIACKAGQEWAMEDEEE